MELIKIPDSQYDEYKYDVIFSTYKWDPQVGDHNTVARYVLVLTPEELATIEEIAEKLAIETMNIEEELSRKPKLVKKLGIPNKIAKLVLKNTNYQKAKHIRLMRFDFHPTKEGWKISEVNSDVPGGFAESSALPILAAKLFKDVAPTKHFGECMAKEIRRTILSPKNIAFVYCTSYSDDRQVVQFLGEHLNASNIESSYLAPDHIAWKENFAYNCLENKPVDAIIRFFPLEWLMTLPRKSKWPNFFDSLTTSCNHPIAMLMQSKRIPLIWDKLSASSDTWKKFLPETKDPKEIDENDESFIFKPTLGRVGENITIRGVMTEREILKVKKSARRSHKKWIAQKMFDSVPLRCGDEEFHLCIGAFTINSQNAGLYGRISPYARIDQHAKDIAILVRKETLK